MTPDTRNSLILRLSNCEDAEAWDQFVAIYENLIFSLARKMGLQYADSCEVVQEVLFSISKAVSRWQPDENKGRFRDWLFRIARNEILKRLTRRKHKSLASGHSKLELLAEQAADGKQGDSFEMEYRRQIFKWASIQVQKKLPQKPGRHFGSPVSKDYQPPTLPRDWRCLREPCISREIVCEAD